MLWLEIWSASQGYFRFSVRKQESVAAFTRLTKKPPKKSLSLYLSFSLSKQNTINTHTHTLTHTDSYGSISETHFLTYTTLKTHSLSHPLTLSLFLILSHYFSLSLTCSLFFNLFLFLSSLIISHVRIQSFCSTMNLLYFMQAWSKQTISTV